jgi:hypothetical protein
MRASSRRRTPLNASSFGRAGRRLRRHHGGTENASISATVRGSIPNRRATSRRLSPSTYAARRTCPYSSTPFIRRPPPLEAKGHLLPDFLRCNRSIRPLPFRDFLSGAYSLATPDVRPVLSPYSRHYSPPFKTLNL